jgi:virulence-associated protein VagC
LRIPREFELEGDEAIVRNEGDRLIIQPVRKGRPEGSPELTKQPSNHPPAKPGAFDM